MAEIRIENISKSFGEALAVSSLDLVIGDGEFVVLLGPTGAGKTTTLRLVAGLEKADSGRILIRGEEVTHLEPAARDVAFVFQQYSLYPHLSVFDNLAFPLRSPARKMNGEAIRERVAEVAGLLHITHKLDNKSTELSGGEMQRVAIGRALVRSPQAYLMDEPLSSLDAKLRAELRVELKRIQSELGETLLYVTHDQIEAMTMADRIGVIAEGELVQIGTPRQIYQDPDSSYVAARLGHPGINLVPAGVIADHSAPRGTHTLGIRTEHMRVSTGQNGGIRGKVDWIEHLGDQDYLHITIRDQKMISLAEPGSPLRPGEDVSIVLDQPLYFDARGNRIRNGRAG